MRPKIALDMIEIRSIADSIRAMCDHRKRSEPITNEQMKAGRFLKWHKARKRIAFIRENLAAGHMVQITTNLRAVRYSTKHIDMFKATKTGAYVQRGKAWDCIDYCDVRAFA